MALSDMEDHEGETDAKLGALARVAAETKAPEPPAAPRGGRALIQSMSGMDLGTSIPPELMGALSSVMDPKRERRNSDAAFMEGLLAPSASAGSAFLSNAMAAQRSSQENSDKLKAQYIPLIMQAVNQQRQLQFQAAQFDATRMKDLNPQIGAAVAALRTNPNASIDDAHAAVDAVLEQNGIPKQYGRAHHDYLDKITQGEGGKHDPSKVPLALQQIAAQSPTDQQKNDMGAGVTPAQRASLMTSFDLSRGARAATLPDGRVQVTMVAPNPAGNQQFYIDPQGNITAARVPGSVAAATELEGAKEGVRIGNVTSASGAQVPARLGPAAGAAAPQLGLQPGAGGGGGAPAPAAPPAAPQQGMPVGPTSVPRPQAPMQPAQAAPVSGARPAPAAPGQDPRTMAPVGIGQPTAAAATATASAKDSTAAYDELHTFATISAPRNIGLLQSIYQLADKTMTGPGANKIQFVNGVLNTLGITPTADSAQNYQLMQKNLGMLVASQRMGARGGGSDALQTLLQASNPNVDSMNAPAAKEAAAELIAYNRMMMDKDRLAPNPNTTNPAAYADFETKFAQFSDPRIWQMHHAESDKERKRLLSLIPENARLDFLHRAEAAVNNGYVRGAH
jgi:hypothetical protein